MSCAPRFAILAGAGALAVIVGALGGCGINPQPLPPYTNNNTGGSPADAAVFAGRDGGSTPGQSGSGDTGTANPPPADTDSGAGDAPNGAEDAHDGGREDGALDATTDAVEDSGEDAPVLSD